MFVCYILIAAADSVSVQEILKGDLCDLPSLGELGCIRTVNENE